MTTTSIDQLVKDRTLGLGGSDAAAILGISPWATPLDVYLETIGEKPSKDLDDNPRVEWGNRHEPQVAEKYAEVTGRKVRRVNRTLHHKKHSFIIAHIDRDVVRVEGEPKRILECKTAYPMSAEQAEKWGPSGSDEVPIEYVAQCMHYMAVRDAEICDLAVLINGWDFRVYEIKRDEEFIAQIVAKEVEFWERHVLARVPPPPMNESDCKTLWPLSRGKFLRAEAAHMDLLKQFAQLKQELADKDGAVEAKKLELMKTLEDWDGFVTGEGKGQKILLSYKANKKGVRSMLIRNPLKAMVGGE